MSSTTFVRRQTPISADWLNDVNDFVYEGKTFNNLLDLNVKSPSFGAIGDGSTDDAGAFSAAGAFSSSIGIRIPAGVYRLNSNPTSTNNKTWFVEKGASFTGTGRLPFLNDKIISYGDYRSIQSSSSLYNGIFGYLEQNAAITGYGTIGINGVVQSAGGSGGAGEADIAVAGFALHNLASSNGGVWALYGTAVREAGVGGATHPLELDIANMGTTVPLFPHQMFPSGSTPCAWICTGGEITASGAGSPGVASCAVGIVQNDSQVTKTSFFEKGIVFHNTAILGADGTGGIGIAIAFASGHAQQWYNNSGQVIGEIVGTGTVQASNNYRLDFSNFGILVQDRGSGVTTFQIEKVASALNGVAIVPGGTGTRATIRAIGETNVDLALQGKGTGIVDLRNLTVVGTSGSAFGFATVKINGTPLKIQLFNL